MTDDRERHARFLCRMWDDKDWTDLSPRGQWFYMLLTSQASLNRAGVTALTSKRWKRLASGSSVEQQIALAMKELEDAHLIIVDHDTEELLVRSYMRNDGIAKQPNVLKMACRQAREVLSPKLRTALQLEMRRLDPPTGESVAAKSATVLLDATIEALSKGSANPSPDPSRNGSNRRTQEKASPPAETSTPKPLTEPFREPFKEPRGVGEGETSVGKGSSSVVGSVRKPRSQANRGTRIPENFSVSAEMSAWAREKVPSVDIARATEVFVDYWQDKSGKDATKVSWLGTWRNWMRREQEKAPDRRPLNGGGQLRPSTTDRAVAQAEMLKSKPNPDVLAAGGFAPRLDAPSHLLMLPGGAA